MIGSSSTTYSADDGAVTLSFNYDPSVNSDGTFNGDGREIIFRRGQQFVTPNSGNTAFNLKNLVLYDGMIGIGITPAAMVHASQATIGNEVMRLESVATNDDPNFIVIQARGATTDATKTTIWSETPTDNSVVLYEVRVIARQTGGGSGTTGQGAVYIQTHFFKRVSGTTTELSANYVWTSEPEAAWNCVIELSR